jgi:NAD(P)H-hydrate epimerase
MNTYNHSMMRLTREQVRNIDRLAVERYHIPGVVLMENAAIAAANVAGEMIRPDAGTVLILCGGGNNGGDGLAVARHLHNRGYDIRILLTTDAAKYAGEAKINWDICHAVSLPSANATAEAILGSGAGLIVDAIFGTGLTQPPRPPFAEIVAAIEKLRAPVLAIDIPSGLDCDTGRALGSACVVATRTITFVAEKIGFDQPEARKYLGQITVGDIGCPIELIAEAARDETKRQSE